MFADALGDALSATRDSWQAVEDDYPSDYPEEKAAILATIDNALIELEEATRLAAIRVPE
jgi:hypothetical protein